MTKPFLSIIIPYYNAAGTIGGLLTSIARSKHAPPYEVIVVDDGSKDKYEIRNTKYEIPLKLIRLKRNMGPAVARNRGVRAARGKFIVFLDSDVEVFPDTLSQIAKIYTDDPDIVALTGVWVKNQRSRAFFPNFKALRDWSYWINERDKSGYYFLFSTRIASIKRSVFMRLGGFDETYPAPLVEDIELTYRIARRYAIIFAPSVRVRHEFEDFWPIAKKYFLRAFYWTRLYRRRKRFDPVATTWSEAVTTISAVATLFFGLVSLFAAVGIPSISNITYQISNSIWVKLFIGSLLLHIFLIRKFLAFLVREKGFIFAVKGFFTGLILYCFIFAGAAAGRIAP